MLARPCKILLKAPLTSFSVDGMDIEVLRSFDFMGSTIYDDGNCSKGITRSRILGKVSMKELQRVLKDKNISLTTKVRPVKALVFQSYIIAVSPGQ